MDAMEQKVRDSFAKQDFLRTLGAELTRVEPGRVDVRCAFRDDLRQQHGYVHAGVLFTLGDTAAGYAALTMMPLDKAVLSVEVKINLLSPALGESLEARARSLRAGRQLHVIAVDVFALAVGQEKHVATMLATLMCVEPRNGVAA